MRRLLKKTAGLLMCIMVSSVYAEKLSVIWEKEFAEGKNLSSVVHEAVCTSDVLQIIGYAFESQSSNNGKFWLWQIDSAGTMVLQNTLHTVSNRPSSAIGFGSWRTKGMKIDQTSMYCVGKFGTGEPSFAHYEMNEKTFQGNPIQPNSQKTSEDIEKGYAETVLRMVSLSDKHFLLVGSDTDSKGIVKKVDSSGGVLWHRVYDKDSISFMADAVEVGNSLILLECYTAADPVKNPYEGYHCRLIQCDLEGRVLSEKSFVGGGAFPNKHPELHMVDSNSFLVGYDRYSLPNQMGYSVAAYDHTLQPLWEKTVVDKGEPSRIPVYTHILPIPSGGFVAAYTEMAADEAGMNIQVQRYSVAGALTDTLLLQNYAAMDDFQLAGSDQNLFVIASTVPDNMTYRVNVKIGAIAIE